MVAVQNPFDEFLVWFLDFSQGNGLPVGLTNLNKIMSGKIMLIY